MGAVGHPLSVHILSDHILSEVGRISYVEARKMRSLPEVLLALQPDSNHHHLLPDGCPFRQVMLDSRKQAARLRGLAKGQQSQQSAGVELNCIAVEWHEHGTQ